MLSTSSSTPIELVRCIYDEREACEVVSELGASASRKFAELKFRNEPLPTWYRTARPGASESYQRAGANFLMSLVDSTTRFYRLAAQVKHSGFEEEREWRVVCFGFEETLTARIKSRLGPFGPAPYVEIPLGLADPDNCPLRRIIIGPGGRSGEDRIALKNDVEAELRKYAIRIRSADAPRGVEVAFSEIPYRTA